MKSTLALALALGLPSVVMAVPEPGAGLQQKGQPQADASTLTTYGIDVPVRTALKSLIPTGWRLFVHKSASLPSAMSWKPGDRWTDVLNKAALGADLATLVDWDTKTVLVRNRETALQESAVRTEIAQAASTPLPRFSTEAPAGEKLPAHKASTGPVAEHTAAAAPQAPEATKYAINTTPLGQPEKAQALTEQQPGEAAKVASSGISSEKVAVMAVAVPVSAKTEHAENSLAPAAELAKSVSMEHTANVALTAEIKTTDAAAVAQAPVGVSETTLDVAKASQSPASVDQGASLEANAPVSVAAKPEPVAPAVSAESVPSSELAQLAQERSSGSIEEHPPLSDKDLAQAVARAINERSGAPQSAPRYVVDDQGNITAQDAFGALAAVGDAQKARLAKDVPAPAAAELVAETNNRPAALATLRAMQEAPRVEAPSGEFKDVRPAAESPAARMAAAQVVAAKESAPVLVIAKAPAPKAAEVSAQVQSARTPAQAPTPTFAQKPSIEASGPAQPLMTHAAMPADVPMVPVFRVNPTQEMVKSAAAVAAPARLVSTKDFTYTAPVALNKAPAKTVAQAIASRFNLRLVWIAPDIRLQGPVTLLAESAEQDIELLRKALGRFSSVNLEISPIGDLRVVSKDEGYVRTHQAAAAKSAAALAQAEEQKQAELIAQAKSAATAGGKAPAAAPNQSSPAAPVMQLVLEAGETLENVLKNFLSAQGYTHEWLVAGGFEANRRLSFEGANLTEVLSKALPPLGISADIYTTDKHIVIRPGDYRE